MRTDDELWDRDALVNTRSMTELRTKAVHAIERIGGMRDVIKEQATRFVESLDVDEDDLRTFAQDYTKAAL